MALKASPDHPEKDQTRGIAKPLSWGFGIPVIRDKDWLNPPIRSIPPRSAGTRDAGLTEPADEKPA